MPDETTNGWAIWAKRVLHALEQLETGQEATNNKITELKIDIAVLKDRAKIEGAKSGAIYGAIIGGITSGVVTLITTLIIYLLTKS